MIKQLWFVAEVRIIMGPIGSKVNLVAILKDVVTRMKNKYVIKLYQLF